MKNWKIGLRITAGFTALILITTALGFFALNRVGSIAKNTAMLGSNYFPSVLALSAVQSNLYHYIADLQQLCASSDPQVVNRLDAEILALVASNNKNFAFYESTPFAPQEQARYEDLKRTRAKFMIEFNKVREVGRSTDPAAIAKSQVIFDHDLRPLFEEYSGLLQALVEMNKAGANAGMEAVQESVTSTIYGVWIGMALCIAFAIPVSIIIVRGITRPLATTVDALRMIANDDLSAVLKIDSKDEVGLMAQSLNVALERLRKTLSEVADAAVGASCSSRELAAVAAGIASGSQEQAASLEETSASLEEITATVRQSADNAQQANNLASGSRETAERGQAVIASTITAMSEINVSSGKISAIISTIDEIAFQTNMLAVNAAVEAARAGEHGRGFGVVASEVRSLAMRSASAAKEIKGLIQDSLKKVEKGSELVNKSGEMLQGIVGSVNRVTDIISEIAAAAKEQSVGVEQVSTAMTQMDQVTQSNAGETERLSATAESLSFQAAHLQELIATFRLGDTYGPTSEPSVQTLPLTRNKPAPRPVDRTTRSVVANKPASRFKNGSRQTKHTAVLAAVGSSDSDSESFEEF